MTQPDRPAQTEAQHDLHETGDADAPDCVKDRNGDVVLGLCRKCGRGEVELSQPCRPAPDLDALLDTFYKTQQYADMGDEERKPPRQVIADAARATIVAEFTSLRERVAALEAALTEIRDRHIPDQPSALDIDENVYLKRQYAELRRIATAALKGAAT